jgi:hypothetical protein
LEFCPTDYSAEAFIDVLTGHDSGLICFLGDESIVVEGELGDSVIGPNQTGTPIDLGPGKNGTITFSPGSCSLKCKVSVGLPTAAKQAVPANAIATMYVQQVTADGSPATGSYTVCFANPDGAALTVYRFVSGAWVAVGASTLNPICTTATGDGAFYLGN